MHKLLTEILDEHPEKTIYLSLGKSPRVASGNGTVKAFKEYDLPLTPEMMAEIINSLITDDEGSALKCDHFVETEIADEHYFRSVSIQFNEKAIDVRIISRVWKEVDVEHQKMMDIAHTLDLIKGNRAEKAL